MRLYIIPIFLLMQGLHFIALAQKDIQIVVGYPAYVFSFNEDTITRIDTTGIINFFRKQASLTDTQGTLIFYTNGASVYNKMNDIMDGGDTLLVSQYGKDNIALAGSSSSFQGVLALTKSIKTNRHYVIYNDYKDSCFTQFGRRIFCGLYAAEIDMEANNGLGKVLNKGQILYEGLQSNSKLTACRHANGRDWWVVKNAYNSNRWIKFLVAPQGIEGPFFQNIGSPAGELDDGSYAAFSNNGSLFVNSLLGSVEVMDFDRCTGMMSNVRTLNIPYNRGIYGVMGIAFSPSDKYMYIISLIESFQYNISSSDWQGSAIRIADLWNTPYDAEKCFLAPDGKIYIGNSCGGVGLTVINNPEAEGTACNITYDNKFGVLLRGMKPTDNKCNYYNLPENQ